MTDKKEKKYEAPKAVDLEGQELTRENLDSVAGGRVAATEGDCNGGGCCSGGSHSSSAAELL